MESAEGRADIEKARALGGVASDLGISMARMAIAWCLKNANVSTVILGASTVEQLRANLASLDDVRLLTDDVISRIEQVLQNRPELPTQI